MSLYLSPYYFFLVSSKGMYTSFYWLRYSGLIVCLFFYCMLTLFSNNSLNLRTLNVTFCVSIDSAKIYLIYLNHGEPRCRYWIHYSLLWSEYYRNCILKTILFRFFLQIIFTLECRCHEIQNGQKLLNQSNHIIIWFKYILLTSFGWIWKQNAWFVCVCSSNGKFDIQLRSSS